jgi:hypothetical protein
VVLHEGRIIGEDIAVVGIFDMRFEGQRTLALGQLEDRKQHGQQFNVVVLVVRLAAFHHPAQMLAGGKQDRLRIGDDEAADRRPENDQHLKWLPEHTNVAVRHVSAQNRTDNDGKTDQEEHRQLSFPDFPLPGGHDAKSGTTRLHYRRCSAHKVKFALVRAAGRCRNSDQTIRLSRLPQ